MLAVDPVSLPSQRRVLALTPSGRMLDDAFVDELAAESRLTLLCGRYEGFDQRIIDHFVSEPVSIGRYVLAGGEWQITPGTTLALSMVENFLSPGRGADFSVLLGLRLALGAPAHGPPEHHD